MYISIEVKQWIEKERKKKSFNYSPFGNSFSKPLIAD